MGKKIVTVFGSSKPVERDVEYMEAMKLGEELAKAGFDVCNGGYSGTMEASARGAKEAGAVTYGVTMAKFKATPNRFIDKDIKTENLYERLSSLLDKGDAYVVLKGGTGTLLELSLTLELILKGMMKAKPLILLGKYFEPVIELVRQEAMSNDKSYPRKTLGIIDEFLFIVENQKDAVAKINQMLGR